MSEEQVIKPDPDAIDESYEDSLDLDFSRSDTKVWLVRLPKFLMEKWRDVEHNSGKELGRVRINNDNGRGGKWKVQLLLNDDEDPSIPHQYDLSLLNQVVKNTYIFTEKDMPKYEKNSQSPSPPPPQPVQAAPVQNKSRFGRFGNRQERFTPYVKTIPKRTALVGTVCHECMITPSLGDAGYSAVVQERKKQQDDPSVSKVTLLSEPPGVTSGTFSQSLKGTQSKFMRAQKKSSATSSSDKATRLPRNDLLDLLFKLFEEFDYWSLKGLKDRTKQPEVYLKEILETMATLIKKGPYAMRYSLKPEYKVMKDRRNGVKFSEVINEENNNSNGSNDKPESNKDAVEDDDDDDDEEMETVI